MNEITADTRTGVQTQPDLFVAYAESDTGWVHGFLLPELGLDSRSVLTPQDFRPGAALVEELDRAVETARLTVLVLSRAFATSQWSAFAELLATHDTLRRNAARLVPVLLEAYELPLHLDFRVRLDCTARSRWEAEATRLRQLLERGPPPTERLPCPYPGLLAFGPEEAACSSAGIGRATTSAVGSGSTISCWSWAPRGPGSPHWCRRAWCPG